MSSARTAEPTAAPPAGERLLVALDRGKGTRLQVVVGTFKDKPLVSARVFYRKKDNAEFRPTTRGAAIRPDELPAVIRGLVAAAAELGIDLELQASTHPKTQATA